MEKEITQLNAIPFTDCNENYKAEAAKVLAKYEQTFEMLRDDFSKVSNKKTQKLCIGSLLLSVEEESQSGKLLSLAWYFCTGNYSKINDEIKKQNNKTSKLETWLKHIEKAKSSLDNNYYPDYFEKMDEVVPKTGDLKATHEAHRQEFIYGNTPSTFNQRLRTFTKKVENYLISTYGTDKDIKSTTAQNADAVELLTSKIQKYKKLKDECVEKEIEVIGNTKKQEQYQKQIEEYETQITELEKELATLTK